MADGSKLVDAAVVWRFVKMSSVPPVLPPTGTPMVMPFERKIEVEVAKRQFVRSQSRFTMQQPGR